MKSLGQILKLFIEHVENLIPVVTRGNDYEENKNLLAIFMKFYNRKNLNKLDWLTLQDL